MNATTRAVLFAAVLMTAGCRAGIDGDYAPGCIAFAGSNIELTGGRFVWERFTDQIEVDASGNAVDPFPGYPVSGSYALDEHRVVMTGDDGRTMEDMYLHEIDGELRLLTREQNDAWTADGSLDECALKRQPTG